MSYTFSLSRRSLPVRCLCLLLAVLVLWCFFMVPRAGAVATEAATVAYAGALIGTILVGAGVVFSSHGDMQAVGAAMYKSWIKSSNAIGSAISGIASWALEHGEAVAKGALRVGKDMYQAVVDAFDAAYDSGSQTWGSNIIGGSCYIDSDAKACLIGNVMEERKVSEFTISGSSEYGSGRVYLAVEDERLLYTYIETSSGVKKLTQYNFIYYSPLIAYYFSAANVSGGRMYFSVDFDYSGGTSAAGGFTFKYPFTISFEGCPVGSVSGSDIAYPSDDYLVRMPDIPSVDTATGTATFPSDAAYTKDAVAVPYPVDTEGVKVPDIPYDKVVDQSTGKTLDDADTGTDTKPGEGTGEGTETGSGVSGLIGTIIGLLKNFFDSPSDFKLDMDGFRNLAIADKFPFCIPFDMVDSVKQFAATAADYQFRIKFDTQYFSVDHTVDLTPIAVPLAFFRYIVCVWFVWVLMSRTHDLMKW